jgi:hypothetical protein
MRLVLTLLLLPILAGAQVYDSAGFVKVRPVVIRDTVTLPAPPPVIIRDTIRITRDTTIYRDTCLSGGNPTDPPPPVETDRFDFVVQQRSLDNIARPFGGIEYWHDQNIVNIPYTPADVYFRLSVCEVQTGRGVYNWSKFDRWFTDAVARGRKLSFGFMTVYPSPPSDRRVSYSGSYSAVPVFWFEDMQADGMPGWRSSNSGWIPNYNAPSYWKNLEDFHHAVYQHLKDKNWLGWVNTVDVRGVGSFGEWHHHPYAQQMSAFPSGTRPTEASMKRIVDAHIRAFPDLWLVAMISGFDGNRLQNTMNPPGIRDYLLTVRNEKGLLGWRRDNWGATDSYITQYLSDPRALERWKYAPVLGEPCCNSGYAALPAQVSQYHAVSFGNGNYGSVTASNVQEAAKRAGHRLTITGGSFKDGVVTINWRNDGLTPIYEAFNVVIELRQGSQVRYTATRPLPWVMPGATQQVEILFGLPSGSYELHIFVKNEQRAYPLGIVGSKVGDIKL